MSEYAQLIESTDKLPPDDLHPVLLGLFGEVGSIMATAKKIYREKEALIGLHQAVVEEFGDVLWYLTAICRRLNVQVDSLFSETTSGAEFETLVVESDLPNSPVAKVSRSSFVPELDKTLLRLGEAAATVLLLAHDSVKPEEPLRAFVGWYVEALQAANMAFAEVVDYNGSFRCSRTVISPYFR